MILLKYNYLQISKSFEISEDEEEDFTIDKESDVSWQI
jgi:hypothetical protein